MNRCVLLIIVGFIACTILCVGCDESQPETDFILDPTASSLTADQPRGLALRGSSVELELNLVGKDGAAPQSAPTIQINTTEGSLGGIERTSAGRWLVTIEAPPEPGQAQVSASVDSVPLALGCSIEFVAPCDPRHREPGAAELELAQRWAPVLLQLEDDRVPTADLPADFEFDGDAVARNNWDDLERYPIAPTVYWAVISTRTHHFIFYGLLYPRRPGTFADNSAESLENAMSAALLVVERDAEQDGPPLLLQTFADGQLLSYAGDPSVGEGFATIDGPLPLDEQGRPRLVIQGRTHALLGGTVGQWEQAGPATFEILVPPEGEPRLSSEWRNTYQLRPLLSSLWAERFAIGPGEVFAATADLSPKCRMPLRFDSLRYAGGEPLWAFDDLDDGPIARGEWFFNPAWTVSQHFQIEGRFSRQYTHHPYAALILRQGE